MKKYLSLLLSVVMICMMFTACAAQDMAAPEMAPGINNSFDSMVNGDIADGYLDYEESAPDAPDMKPDSGEGSTGTGDASMKDYLESQKLVYKCNVKLETLKFQETMNAIDGLVTTFDGFVESNTLSDDSWGWYYSDYNKTNGTLSAQMTIRIPTQNYHKFLDSLEGEGKIRSKTENVTNITKKYNDTKTTIEVLEKERDMLLEMMDKAVSISDMMEVERRLSVVQQDLALYQSSLSSMNMDINFSTITISVSEVMEYTREEPVKTTFIERILEAGAESIESFAEFLEGLTIALIYCAPYIIIFGSIAIVIIVKARKARRNKGVVKGSVDSSVDLSKNQSNIIKEADNNVDADKEKAIKKDSNKNNKK